MNTLLTFCSIHLIINLDDGWRVMLIFIEFFMNVHAMPLIKFHCVPLQKYNIGFLCCKNAQQPRELHNSSILSFIIH